MTSLDMAGMNFSVLKLDANTLKWVDAPTEMLGWPKVTTPRGQVQPKSKVSPKQNSEKSDLVANDLTSVKKTIEQVCTRLISAEVELNDLDAITGDGDCGSTTKLGAQGVLKMLGESSATSYSSLVYEIGSVLEKEMGGSSGSLLSILFTAMSAEMRKTQETTISSIGKALGAGIDEMMHVGRAQPGDRTMLDALIPAQKALLENADFATSLSKAAEAAESGAESTKTMVAKAGRAAYCKDRNVDNQPDSGAVMVAKAFKAML